MRITSPHTAIFVTAVFAALIAPSVPAAELTLANFNNMPMHWTWGGYQYSSGPTQTRIYDTADSTGGAGRSLGNLNLTSLADARFVVDFTKNAGNGSNNFSLTLADSADRRGTWTFNTTAVATGTPTTMVSTTTLGSPTGGTDQANLDLANISFFQIDGEWSNPSPFDFSFDNLKLSTEVAPPSPYPGYEANAPWRAEAAARIDAIRKADFNIHVTDATGRPLSGATVAVALQQHEFGFGSAVTASRLRDTNPAHAVYKEKVEQLFNVATIENNLKWPAWIGEWGSGFTQAGALAAVDWLLDNDISVRGHNIIWPGYSKQPNGVKQILDGAPLDASEQATLRTTIDNRIDDIASRFAGKLSAWDVVNEPWDNHDVMDNLPEGNAAMAAWFERVRANDPTAVLYLNEYNILSTGGATNTAKQQFYYDTLVSLKNSGAPLGGIGFQGHFNETNLSGPEQVWEILDRFAALGLDMQITEFDFGTENEQLQAAYTRDFLTAIFAHEGMDDFVMWGFWENAHWRPDAAMFRSDWSIKPNGEAYLDLVFDEWWTDESLASDAQGLAALRGFKGKYLVTVTLNGETIVVPATLTDGGLELDIALPILAGDFDLDGDVDGRDFLVWQRNPSVGNLADWQANYGVEILAASIADSTTRSVVLQAVPEPSVLVLAAIALLLSSQRKLCG
jgi:GH35 family endo-1,4-beta-xylanase